MGGKGEAAGGAARGLAACALIAAAMAVWTLSATADEPRPRKAAAEVVELSDGRSFQGLIESEDAVWVNLIQIQRPAGQPAHVVVRPIDKRSIARIARLADDERAKLRSEIDEVRNRAAIEAVRMDAVELGLVSEPATRFRYRGRWFELESGVDEAITRRMVVQLEQMFTAYRQLLPPKQASGIRRQASGAPLTPAPLPQGARGEIGPLTPAPPPQGARGEIGPLTPAALPQNARGVRIEVFGTMADYRARLTQAGVKSDSPACFVPADNVVLAGSELNRFAAEFTRLRSEHDRLQSELVQIEKQKRERLAELAKQMQADGVAPANIKRTLALQGRKFDDAIAQKQNEVQQAERANDRKLQAVAQRTLAQLYHEGFHAYLENYVYPRAEHDVPLWLNEGWAQVCEAGVFENGTLRIDAPQRDLLAKLKAELAGAQPLPLPRVLAAGPGEFQGSQSQRYYVYAWGLAYHLAYGSRALDRAALDKYVARESRGLSAVERFEQLVGQKLPEFEKRWQREMGRMR